MTAPAMGANPWPAVTEKKNAEIATLRSEFDDTLNELSEKAERLESALAKIQDMEKAFLDEG